MKDRNKQIKFSFLRELHLILKDLDKLLEYIEPSDNNINTFSHRIFELQLRTCTALESVFKHIYLNENSNKDSNNLKIIDYYCIKDRNVISQYTIRLDSWRTNEKLVMPFENWQSEYKSLTWWDAYNKSKHNRDTNFTYANFGNLIEAICGLIALLHSQYHNDIFGQYQDTTMYHESTDKFIFCNDSIFSVKPPQ